jgi:hypothetical protein
VPCPLLHALPQKLATDPANSGPAGLATALPHHCYATMGSHSGLTAQISRWEPNPASGHGDRHGPGEKAGMAKCKFGGLLKTAGRVE